MVHVSRKKVKAEIRVEGRLTHHSHVGISNCIILDVLDFLLTLVTECDTDHSLVTLVSA